LKNRIKHILAILPALVLFAYFANQLNFIQDDAYISYRYVENFLNGDGLVYNIGERIEGFTNFAWVIYLIMLAKLGINYILVSQITGFIFGGGVIVLTYLIAGMIFERRNRWFVLLPTYLVGANISLAYWAQAGLETGAFAFFAMLSLYLQKKLVADFQPGVKRLDKARGRCFDRDFNNHGSDNNKAYTEIYPAMCPDRFYNFSAVRLFQNILLRFNLPQSFLCQNRHTPGSFVKRPGVCRTLLFPLWILRGWIYSDFDIL